MRILLVNSHGADVSVGGAERYVADLAAALASAGATVLLLSAFPGEHVGPYESVRTLHADDWRTSDRRRVVNRLVDVAARPSRAVTAAISDANVDLVHTHTLPGISTSVWEASARVGVPVVHTLHDYYLLCARSSLTRADGTPCRPSALLCGARTRRLGRWTSRVSAVIAVSEHLRGRHAHLFPGTSSHVVRHALVPTEHPTPPPGDRLRALGYLGSLDKAKGVGELLAAAPALSDDGVALHIAGDGRLRDDVVKAASAGLVSYHGVVGGGEKRAFMEMCDAGVAPSRWEEPGAPPYAVAEWLLAGRPVICSTRGGLGEAARLYEGLVPVEPTRDGILAGIGALRVPQTWQAVTRAAGAPVGSPDDDERWLTDHCRIYEAAIAV